MLITVSRNLLLPLLAVLCWGCTVTQPTGGATTAPVVSLAATKMNVLYIGVDNPLEVTAAGVALNEIKVESDQVSVSQGADGQFVATASRPGEATLLIKAGDKILGSKSYRVKRIPDPVARLSRSSGGRMGNGEFKAQGGVGAFIDNFDFDVRCAIQGYELTYLPKRGDPISSLNVGARYNAKSQRLIRQAKPGDVFYFTNVKAKCPGDAAGRTINTMVFRIQ
ncbi:MAG: GldM family protein [Bacteroidota bacterium]